MAALADLPASPSELQLWLAVVRPAATEVRPLLHAAWAAAPDLNRRARLAIAALHLGDAEPAREMFTVRTDPTQFVEYRRVFALYRLPVDAEAFAGAAGDPLPRTALLTAFPDWHGDPAELVTAAERAADGPSRSGLLLCLGLLGRKRSPVELPPHARKGLERLYARAPDAGTHAAARYALQRLGLPLPALPQGPRRPAGRDWFVNSAGQTMIRVDPTPYVAGARLDDYDYDFYPHAVRLTRLFYLADREVSVALYRAFLTDAADPGPRPNYAASRWEGPNQMVSPTDGHPVQRVSWYDAVMFCNWLSRKEGRPAAYHIDPGTDPPTVTPVAHGDGYRLPTQAEWEYCARAGAHTRYPFGDAEDGPLYAEMVRESAGRARPANPVGWSMPNAFGFADLNGNVWEYCWDVADGHPWPVVSDNPIGPAGPLIHDQRVARGGGVANAGGPSDVSAWYNAPADYRGSNNLGFRVAAGDPQEPAPARLPAARPRPGRNLNRVMARGGWHIDAVTVLDKVNNFRGSEWTFEAGCLHDKNPSSVWACGKQQAVSRRDRLRIEVTFASPTAVRQVTVLGSRPLLPGYGQWFVTECRITARDAQGRVLYEDTRAGGGPFHDFDWHWPDPLRGVKSVRFTPTKDTAHLNGAGAIALGEILIDGDP